MNIDLVEIAGKPEWKQLLFEIVEREKLDPWDINLSLLTNRFVDHVKTLKKLNLHISANVLLAASILLRYKSDSWVLRETNGHEPDAVYIPDGVYSPPVIPELEGVMRVTKRKVSLDELIAAVEDVITREKRKSRPGRAIKQAVPDALLALLEEDSENFDTLLKSTFDKVKGKIDKENLVLFSAILEKEGPEDVINNLIPLLHLATKQKIGIWQEEVFGEIFIHLLEPEYEVAVA